MALIIKCSGCGKRLKDALPCPVCGEIKRRFWVDHYPDGRNGKRVQKPLDEKIQNLETASAIDRSTRAANLESRKPGAVKENLTGATIEDLTPDYLQWVRLNKQPGTYTEREYTMVYINRIIGDVPIETFNDHHVSLFQKIRKAQGVSNKTINKELYYVMAFLKWCREEKEMAVRPVKMKKLPYARPLPIVLSPGEVSRILQAATPFYRAFFLCLYTLGLRFSEAQGLKWDDVDIENMAIRCRQKGGTFKILPMHSRLKAALKKIGPPARGKYVFLSKRTGRPIVNVRRAIKAICLKAGITKHVHPHLFRHSVATAMMGAGINLRTVQIMLGHAEIGTTEFYTHVAMEHLRGAESAIEAGISTPSGRKIKQIGPQSLRARG